MCLGIPAKVSETYEKDGMLMAKADFGGVQREVCMAYTPEAQVGDYILIHAGFALNIISEEEANETLDLLKQIAAFDETSEMDSPV